MAWVIPLKFIFTGGNRHEIIKAEKLIETIHHTNLIVDKAYDSDKFREIIENQGCTHTIPLP
jgi:transposase